MPEGDTVWRTARRLHAALEGEPLTASDLRVPQHATADLSGRTVQEVTSRGKHLLHRVGDDLTLHTHLKMEGSWHLYRPGSRWRRPGHQARVVLRNDTWVAVGFSLGAVDLVRRDEEARLVGHLGPDLLGADWDADEAVRRLRGQPRRPIADALLDQRNLAGANIGLSTVAEAVAAGRWIEGEAIHRLHAEPDRAIGDALLDQRKLAGLGTLYRSETLFLVGVHPETPVSNVEALSRLLSTARRLMLNNRDRAEQVTTGDLRRGQQHWVFDRAGQPCRRCGATIERGWLGPVGKERVSYVCPRCQPGAGRR